MHNRISQIIKDAQITKTEFAKKLNVSQAFVSQICSGVSNPSDRTIFDICSKFDIDENWLRTGEGEMHIKLTPREELARFTAQLQREDSFRARFVAALEALEPEDWAKIQQFVDMLASKSKTGPN